jgi:hypothetical protein
VEVNVRSSKKVEISRPDVEGVREACRQFDQTEETKEAALKELFGIYPKNNTPWQVLLKVVAVNQLYATFIFYEALGNLAHYICDKKIDSELEVGSPEAVIKIASAPVGLKGEDRSTYSFATKYCSWHRPDKYAIYDGFVHRYLWDLHKQKSFSESLRKQANLLDYRRFISIVNDFQHSCGLESFTFKEIDKFLWQTEKDAEKAKRPRVSMV